MVYAKELAPNLFNTFDAWYDNYVNEVGSKPTRHDLKLAVLYFMALELENG